jgi:hypothetical protein
MFKPNYLINAGLTISVIVLLLSFTKSETEVYCHGEGYIPGTCNSVREKREMEIEQPILLYCDYTQNGDCFTLKLFNSTQK